jgi:hypothetical protein
MREGLSVLLKVLLRDPASCLPASLLPTPLFSGVIHADAYLTLSLWRVNGPGLEWCGRELVREVLVAAEVVFEDPDTSSRT